MHVRIRTIGLGLAPLALGLALGLAPLSARAQDAPSVSTQTRNPVLFDIAFPGGQLSEFANLLQSRDANANIFVQSDAADFPVPAMTMRQVDVSACIWTLDLLQATTGDGSRREIMTDSYTVPGGSQVYVLSNRTSGPARSTNSQRTSRSSNRQVASVHANTVQLQVMSVGDLLQAGFTSTMILDDIKQLQSLDEEDSQPIKAVIDIKTGILMVRGTRSQIDQIWELHEALGSSVSYRMALQREADQAAANAAGGQVVAVRMLTQEQLAEMSSGELQDRMVKLAQLRKRARGNQEQSDQINEQFNLTMAAIKLTHDVD